VTLAGGEPVEATAVPPPEGLGAKEPATCAVRASGAGDDALGVVGRLQAAQSTARPSIKAAVARAPRGLLE